MKKLNTTMYHKMLLQAEEAKQLGMHKLANAMLNTVGPIPEDENITYTIEQLQDDVYQQLWNGAAQVMKYHDVKTADVARLHDTIEVLANKLIEDIEQSLDIAPDTLGPLEDKIIGQE